MATTLVVALFAIFALARPAHFAFGCGISPVSRSALTSSTQPPGIHLVAPVSLPPKPKLDSVAAAADRRAGAASVFARPVPNAAAAPSIRARVYVEDAPPPSLEEPQAAWLALPVLSPARLLSPPPAPRTALLSASNRQRAP